ncbi:hypothetical protein [Endozoicomonas lisbonensis]|uniref:Tetratricopeptide (TPR) repeat protein n=1 Tax=Endozoicomonas lisbonensis TaxID=3120522 RepID=A0ABV2SLV3_9GAMM
MDIPPTPPARGTPASSGKKKRGRNKEEKAQPGRQLPSPDDGLSGIQSSPQSVRLALRKADNAESKKIQVAKLTRKMQEFPVKKGDEMKRIIEEYSVEALRLKEQVGPTLEVNYALTYCAMGKGDWKQARVYCDALVQQVKDNSIDQARALLLRGKIAFDSEGGLTDASTRDIARAYQLGNPEAGRFLMQARTGWYSTVCLLEWCDPLQLVEIAQKLPTLRKNYMTSLAQEVYKAKSADNKGRELMYRIVNAFETIVQPDERKSFATWFPLLICEMFEKKDDEQEDIDKHMRVALELYARRGNDVKNSRAIYHHARIMRSGITNERLQSLLDISNATAYMFAGDALLKYCPDNYEDALYLLRMARLMPVTYQLRIEALLERNQLEEALAVCQQAVNHITEFLNGENELFGKVLGEQAAAQEQKNPDRANSMRFAELHAANALLEKYQNQAELFEEALSQPRQEPEVQSVKTETAEDTGGVVAIEAAGDEIPLTGQPPASEVVDRQPEVNQTEGAVGQSATAHMDSARQPASLSDSEMQSVINRANDLIRNQSELDRAEELLLNLKPESGSLMWYRKQQSLCWLYHEQGTSYDYLFGKVAPGERASDLAQAYLKKSDKLAKRLIKDLVKMAENTSPELLAEKTPDAGASEKKNAPAVGRLYTDHKHYMAVARVLEQKNPGFRKLYGGLYSVLGHIQKACCDNPAVSGRIKGSLQEGITWYRIANSIRGYGGVKA